jgi:hypothetical protein
MTYTEQTNLRESSSALLTSSAERNTARTNFRDFSAEVLKESIVSSYNLNHPIEELVATGEAVFEFIKNSEMETEAKNAFYQLEKQFIFYRNLCLMRS